MRTKIFLLTSVLALAAAPFFLPGSAAAVGVGKKCGGIAGIKCDEGLWCDPSPGKCGGADIQGKCVQPGFVCYMLYQPVCGCNNVTYSNDCWRRMARVPLKAAGACK
jgi:Kazal-type serine protease inhibitor-like protein